MKNDNPFPIRYKRVENGGKHRAINNAVQMTESELFFIVDSDDILLEDAIEKVLAWIDTLDAVHKWAGVSGARGYTPKDHIGGISESKYVDAKNTERIKYNLTGDKAEVYYTNVLKNIYFQRLKEKSL